MAIAANSSQQPWIKHSAGDKSCYTLIHTLPQTLRECICKSTECDATSKVGTKAAALKANLHFWAVFEQIKRPNFLAPKEAERYHSSVLYSKENCNTFDDLQCILYTKMNKTLWSLPSTDMPHGQALRSHYIVLICSNLISAQESCEILLEFSRFNNK